MKTCTKCKQPKDESEFSRRSGSPIGLKPQCKCCASAAGKEYYFRDHEKTLSKDRRKRELNRPRIKAQQRAYQAANRERINANSRVYQQQWVRRRYHNDPTFKLTQILRSRLHNALRPAKTKKRGNTLSLLGCPVVWLEVHLESLFKPGMTWENHGLVWHIDHIKPCAKFNLSDPQDQKACFHWTNLQPLFVADNLRKSDSYHG